MKIGVMRFLFSNSINFLVAMMKTTLFLSSRPPQNRFVTSSVLSSKKCVPCESGTAPLTFIQAKDMCKDLHSHWRVDSKSEKLSLVRKFKVTDFSTGLRFFNKINTIAEQEAHHPDLHLTNFNQVTIELMTHAIKGLSENDFILAAKIDTLQPNSS